MKLYDVVVVGAGNAGLSAAITCALAGKKTLVIEQHNLPGGCASSFRRGRFEIEPSLHELCDVGPLSNPGDVRKMFDEYGLKVEWCEVPDCFRVVSKYRDGGVMDVTMPSGIEAFKDAMEKYVPGSRPKMDELFELQADSNVLKEKYPNMLRTGAYPTQQVFDALKLPKRCQDILSTYWGYLGVDMEHLSFIHYAAMVHKYISRGAYIPKHTSHELSNAFIERFRELGGEIWFNCRAEEFLFTGDRLTGVRTNLGVIDTKYVLANINPDIIYGKMMPKELLGIKDYSIFMPESSDSAEEYKNMTGSWETNDYSIFLCYNVANPDASPEGTCICSFTTFSAVDDWNNVTPEKYVELKNKIAKKFLWKLKEKTGITLQGHIEEMSVATPWTFARYLNAPEGSVYGYETRDWDGMMARMMMLSQDYPIKGMRPIGTAGPRGDGYSSAYICGQLLAKLAIKDLNTEEV